MVLLSPVPTSGRLRIPITAEVTIAATAMISANRPALLAPSQFTTPMTMMVTTHAATIVASPWTPK